MASKIKVSEKFYSLQGEAKYTGTPSVFLRTFGCNFTCSGFGMSRGEKSSEADQVSPINFTRYEDLPLVKTGCDSYPSWHPNFKELSPFVSTDELAGQLIDLLPEKQWGNTHLVITGGEPLLGWQRAFPDLLSHQSMVSLKNLTFETNGTQLLSKEFRKFLLDWTMNNTHWSGGVARGRDRLTFSVSPKLSISGEKWEDAIKPEVIAQYQFVGDTYLKFVVATQQDVEDSERAVEEYRNAGFNGDIYLMPCGGVEEVFLLNNRTVADLALQKGWKYSDRLQVTLYSNKWGT